MKKLLLTLFGVLIALPTMARDFTYTYAGQTINYTVVDEDAKTCKTVRTNVSGDLTLPSNPKDGNIEYTLVEIGAHAFYECTGLTSITIPNSVTEIGDYAFRQCWRLTSISIPNSVTKIGNYTFGNCSGLTSIVISEYISSFGEGAFCACTSLNTIYVALGNRNYTSVDGIVYSKDMSQLVQYPAGKEGTEFTIPNSVNTIGASALEGCRSLHTIIIPNSVTAIGNYAFAGCSNLTSVTIGNSVTSISRSAFDRCTGLTSVTYLTEDPLECSQYTFSDYTYQNATLNYLESTEEKIASTEPWCRFINRTPISNVTHDFTYTYAGQTITYTIIDEDAKTCMTKQGVWPTSGNNVYGDLILPSNPKDGDIEYTLVGISDYAFFYSRDMTSVSIPNSVTSIGLSAFSGCSSLTSIEVKNLVPPTIYEPSFSGLYDSVKLTIPQQGVNEYLNSNWIWFKDLNIRLENGKVQSASASDGTLDYYLIPAAGADDKNLAIVKPGNYSGEITVPERFTYTDAEGNNTRYYVSGIGNQAFKNSSIIKINFNSRIDLKSIGEEAFYGCTGLTEISIPNSVTSIGRYAFHGCTGLTKAEFSSIEQLCSIKFGGDFSNPYVYAHNLYINGEEVKDLVIPETFSKIGDYTFDNCSGLKSVIIPASVTEIGVSAFSDCTGLTSITIPNYVTKIGRYAFYRCTGLTSASIGNSVTEIDFGAFSGCSGLTSVSIGNSVTEIGVSAFSDCTGLTSVTIPNSVTEIGVSAFSDCTGLTSVTIPNYVTKIGRYAFYRCTGLTSASIGNSVTKIDYCAFYGCSGLTELTFNESTDTIAFGANAIPSDQITSLYWGRYVEDLTFNISNIEALTIGNVATVIPENKFEGLTTLKTLKLGNNISEIEANAFSGCTGLTEVVIPSSVETIGESAFADNTAVTSIIMGANVKNIGDKAFTNCPAENIYITAQTPPEAPNTTFSPSVYTGKLWLQDPGDNSVLDAYYDVYTCWDRFDSYAMVEASEIIAEGEPKVDGKPGEQVQLNAKVVPANATLPHIFWRSTNPDVATVDCNGMVTILAPSGTNERAAGEPCKIIAETLYANGPTAEFTVNSSASTIIEEINVETTSASVGGHTEVYNLRGVMVGESTEDLPKGIYIVREGFKTRKIAI